MFEDWQAIQRLLMYYAECIDSARFADAAALFENATFTMEYPPELGRDQESETLRGSGEVQKLFDEIRVYQDGTTRTKHTIANVNIELDGAAASSSCYVVVFQQTDVLPLQPIVAGRYIDKFERNAGQWRFASRLLRGFLMGDQSQHHPV
jgi:3-phenylpropionate/cinnamic acid dioxygenase small subunit